MKKEKKTTEEYVNEKTADNLLNYIVSSTFARHANLSEEEFLKEIGFENSGKSEDEAIRIAIMNVLTATTKELIQTRQDIRQTNALLKAILEKDDKKEKGKNE